MVVMNSNPPLPLRPATRKSGSLTARLNSLGMRTKITLGFASMVLVLMVVSANGLESFVNVIHGVETYEQGVDVVGKAEDLAYSVLDLRRHVREFAESGEEVDYRSARESTKAVQGALRIAKEATKNPERAQKVQAIGEAVRQADSSNQQVQGLAATAERIGASASQVLSAAEELSRNGERFRKQVGTFLHEERAA